MKHHPAWLAFGLLVFVVLACNLGKKTANVNSNLNSNANSNANAAVDLGSGTFLEEIHMAKDDGNGDPGDETNSFAAGDRTVHCIATLKDPKSGTQMRFAWWGIDAGPYQNKKIQEVSYTTKGREARVHGHLTYSKDWPAGQYKVQAYVNGDLDKTVFYTVR